VMWMSRPANFFLPRGRIGSSKCVALYMAPASQVTWLHLDESFPMCSTPHCMVFLHKMIYLYWGRAVGQHNCEHTLELLTMLQCILKSRLISLVTVSIIQVHNRGSHLYWQSYWITSENVL
jgi:hypothetical protein